MSSLDLTRFLPPRYRDKTIDTLLKSAFNRHLSKEDSIPLFGYVGNRGGLGTEDVKLVERDMERQLNQLVPLFKVNHGTEKKVFSWPDLVQKLQLLGVDYKTIGSWFQSKSYNFAPPIDLDKFCNFNQYFWIGPWIKKDPTNQYFNELGIPNIDTYIKPRFIASNPGYDPDYYVIQRGELLQDEPVSVQPEISPIWSEWSFTNLWVHRADAIEWINIHPGILTINDLITANRPIIEYDNKIKLNSYHVDNVPSDSGTYRPQIKYKQNQPPLFDIYKNDGTPNGVHTGYSSSIFYYQESNDSNLDPVLNRRILLDENGDFIFGHSLVHENNALYFYKYYSEKEIEGIQTESFINILTEDNEILLTESASTQNDSGQPSSSVNITYI